MQIRVMLSGVFGFTVACVANFEEFGRHQNDAVVGERIRQPSQTK